LQTGDAFPTITLAPGAEPVAAHARNSFGALVELRDERDAYIPAPGLCHRARGLGCPAAQ
jgi:hypothetical protein